MSTNHSRTATRGALDSAIDVVRQAIAAGNPGASVEALQAARTLVELYKQAPVSPNPSALTNQRGEIARAEDALASLYDNILQQSGHAPASVGW